MFPSVHILCTCVEFRGCSFKQTKLIASPRKCRQYFANLLLEKSKKIKKNSVRLEKFEAKTNILKH